MILLATGFFIGILYVNVTKTATIIFDENILACFRNYKIDYEKYWFYIIKERVGILLLIILLGQVYWKRIYAGMLTVIGGIMLGSALCLSASKMGVKGLFLCVIGMIPHMIFYGCSLWILVTNWMSDKSRRLRGTNIIGIIMFWILGVLSEVYVSPFVLKIFL